MISGEHLELLIGSVHYAAEVAREKHLLKKIAVLESDSRFLQLALNLSGKRDELEERAAALIDKCGEGPVAERKALRGSWKN